MSQYTINIGTPSEKVREECRKLLRQCSAESGERQDLVLRAALRDYLKKVKKK